MFLTQPVAFMATRRRTACACCAFAVALFLGAGSALADDDDIVNAAGFEAPFFSTAFGGTGQLEGQVNPIGEGQPVSPGLWLRTQGSGSSSAIVQSSIVKSGTQAVKADRGPNSDSRWAVPVNSQGYPDYPNPTPPEPAQPFIFISWDMRVNQAAAPPSGSFAPAMGIEAYDDDGNPVSLLASLFVDSRTGDVLYQVPAVSPTVGGDLTETGTAVSLNQWHHYCIELNYAAHTFKLMVNNMSLGTFGFVDQALVVGGLNQLSDVDLAVVAGAGDSASLGLTATAYYDNFLVREGMCPIPEPAAGALAVFGLLGLAHRRRMGR